MNLEQYMTYRNFSFREMFSEKGIPKWECPHCRSGILYLKNGNLYSQETPKSIAEHNDDTWEPDWMDYRCSAILSCDRCTGKTYCCGRGQYMSWVSSDPQEDSGYEEISFTPTFFEPTLNLFKIPEKCPKIISTALVGSFAIAWTDFSASGNKLRVAIEKLIDEIYPQHTGKLHQRIEKIAKTDPDRAKLLMSIKWLGNDASHDDSLEECDLAFAYKVIEFVLNDIYQNNKINLGELAEIVNASMGVPFKT